MDTVYFLRVVGTVLFFVAAYPHALNVRLEWVAVGCWAASYLV